MAITKDKITGNMHVLVEQKNTNENSIIFCDRIEYIHDKYNAFFDHHLMFYKEDRLIFKVWLKNDENNLEYENIIKAMNDVGMTINYFGDTDKKELSKEELLSKLARSDKIKDNKSIFEMIENWIKKKDDSIDFNDDIFSFLLMGTHYKLVKSAASLIKELKKIKKIKVILIEVEGNKKILKLTVENKIIESIKDENIGIIWSCRYNKKLKDPKINAIIVYNK